MVKFQIGDVLEKIDDSHYEINNKKINRGDQVTIVSVNPSLLDYEDDDNFNYGFLGEQDKLEYNWVNIPKHFKLVKRDWKARYTEKRK